MKQRKGNILCVKIGKENKFVCLRVFSNKCLDVLLCTEFDITVNLATTKVG